MNYFCFMCQKDTSLFEEEIYKKYNICNVCLNKYNNFNNHINCKKCDYIYIKNSNKESLYCKNCIKNSIDKINNKISN